MLALLAPLLCREGNSIVLATAGWIPVAGMYILPRPWYLSCTLDVAHLPPPSSAAASHLSRSRVSMLQSSRSGWSLRVFGDLGLPNGEGIIPKLHLKPELFLLIASVYALLQQTKDSPPYFLTSSLTQSHPITST